MTYTLKTLATDDEWRAFHDIRRIELFEARGRFGIYDAQHPDDRLADNTPLLLIWNEIPVGVMRLDDRHDGTGVVRLVAITGAEQRRGHGRRMQELLEARCRDQGIRMLYVNAAPQAVGFYERTGWTKYVWDPAELVSIASECIQMRKPVASYSIDLTRISD